MNSFARIAIFLFSLSTFAATRTSAQQPAPPLEKQVDQLFSAYTTSTPGCSLGIIRDGNFIYKNSYGLGSLELGVPLSTQSVFYMASVSKQFTAASAVLAAEQGFFSLDDDIRKYIPELPAYARPVTIRHMLHHTSGYRDILGLLQLAGRNFEDIHTTPEMLDLLSRQKSLNFLPGNEYNYSNTNFFLISVLLQRTAKKSLAEFANENIFQPLGMTHTHFHDDRLAVSPGRVSAYAPKSTGGFTIDWNPNFDKVGDGGLLSTVDDLLLWDRNFYDNKLGKGSLLQEIQTPGTLNNGQSIHYALGLEITKYRGLPVVEHGGAMFGYRTNLIRFPQQKFSVVTLCNLATAAPGSLDNKIADLYLADQFPAEPKSATAKEDPTPYAGTYRNPDSHSLLEVSAQDGDLVIYGQHLKSLGPGHFTFDFGGDLQFQFAANAKSAPQLTFVLPDSPAEHFEKIQPLTVPAATLAQYVGDYRSEELQATYRFSIKDEKLIFDVNWQESARLAPSVPDEFQGPGGIALVFHRDAAHRITSFDLHAGRVRNITFTKLSK